MYDIMHITYPRIQKQKHILTYWDIQKSRENARANLQLQNRPFFLFLFSADVVFVITCVATTVRQSHINLSIF
jgi:hypothetical protein